MRLHMHDIWKIVKSCPSSANLKKRRGLNDYCSIGQKSCVTNFAGSFSFSGSVM